MTPSEQFAAMYRSGAQGCEMDWGAAQALAQDIDRLRAENAALREALAAVVGACDAAQMVTRPGHGVSGMTIEANLRGSVYNGVTVWPVEEARAALARQTEWKG